MCARKMDQVNSEFTLNTVNKCPLFFCGMSSYIPQNDVIKLSKSCGRTRRTCLIQRARAALFSTVLNERALDDAICGIYSHLPTVVNQSEFEKQCSCGIIMFITYMFCICHETNLQFCFYSKSAHLVLHL